MSNAEETNSTKNKNTENVNREGRYKSAFIEISGRCNAKCKWCVTGIENLKHPDTMPSMKKNVMDLVLFKKIVNHLLSQGIAGRSTLFSFYNWGEPFLNPSLKKICEFMKENDLKYEWSTNASVPFHMLFPSSQMRDRELFANLQGVTFSYCGFSQKSFDRIHQFDFEKIKANTLDILKNLRQNGFRGWAAMAYHKYQFNQGAELLEAEMFCKNNGLTCSSSYAFINNFHQGMDYLRNKLDYLTLKEMGKDLCFHYVDELIKKERPQDYRCALLNSLVIDENGNLLPCCLVQDEILGPILNYTKKDIEEKKSKIKACKECIAHGLDYWVTYPSTLATRSTNDSWKKMLINQCKNKLSLFGSRGQVIFGANTEGAYLYKFLRERGGNVCYFIDNSPGKWGGAVEDVPIRPFEAIEQENRNLIVLIASKAFRMEMEHELIQIGLKKNEDFYYFEDILNQYLMNCFPEI